MRTKKRALKLRTLVIGRRCFALSLLGRSSTEAAVKGTITDASGAVIPGTTVTLQMGGPAFPRERSMSGVES
jgi:hypothetical protein